MRAVANIYSVPWYMCKYMRARAMCKSNSRAHFTRCIFQNFRASQFWRVHVETYVWHQLATTVETAKTGWQFSFSAAFHEVGVPLTRSHCHVGLGPLTWRPDVFDLRHIRSEPIVPRRATSSKFRQRLPQDERSRRGSIVVDGLIYQVEYSPESKMEVLGR